MLRSLPLLVLASLAMALIAACEPAPCCVDDDACGSGLGCFDGRCSYLCDDDADCAPSEICARPADGRATGVCLAPGEDEGECRERVAPPAPDAGTPQHDAGPADSGRPDAGPDGGPPRDAGPPDAGFDAGPPDAGFDAGPLDAGFDAGPLDAGFDAGPLDAGFDAGPFDAGFDAGPPDAGFDAGPFDAGFDAGPFDGGFDAGPFDAGPGDCVDDEHENNDDRESATVLAPDTTTVTGVLCPEDPDLFRLPVGAGEVVTLTLGYDAPPGMRLLVTRPGEGVLGTSAIGGGLEQVTFTSTTAGFVLVRLAAVSTGDARPYGLVIDRSGNQGCLDDALEPNDSQQQATPLPFPADISAKVCTPDPDFFELNAAGVSQITVELVESAPAGLVVSVLRRPSFDLLGIVSAGGGPEVVDLGGGNGQNRRLLLIVAGSGDADYTLTVE